MKTASISEAKNQLSAYLDLVKRGETVLITDRNVPVARIVPLDPITKGNNEAWFREMERKGIIKPPRKRGVAKLLLTPPPKFSKDASVLEALLDERRNGR